LKTLLALLFTLLAVVTPASAQWTAYQSPLFTGSILRSVQVLDANNVWAVDYDNNMVVKTTNGGLSWLALPVADPAFANYHLESISVLNPNTAWLTASNVTSQPYHAVIYHTLDGGATWQRQPSAYPVPDGQRARVNHFFDLNHGVNLGDKWSSTAPVIMDVLTTSDGGLTWNPVLPASQPATSQPNAGPHSRAFSVINNTIWYIGTDYLIYKSTDKGLTWSKFNPGFPPPGPIFTSEFAISFKDQNNGLAATNGTLKKTTDGGATWVSVMPTGPWYSANLVHVPGTASTYISANQGSSISYDDGNTWTLLETNKLHFDLEFKNLATGWSAGVGNMYKFSGVLGTRSEKDPGNSFFIYPNPANGIFNITSASPESFTLEVYDVVGNKVMQQQGNRFGKNTLDLSGHTKGIYLLHIVSGNQHLIEKVVLQ
jgi:photosystem II stability/assembly factor-like uncharacterized protein